jgi:hypothetical protein
MLPMSRRYWLSVTMGSACSALVRSRPAEAAQSNRPVGPEDRISKVIQDYGEQGFHRTGTSVDRRSGDWLCEEVSRIGLAPTRETFSLNRIDLIQTHLIAGNRRIEGLPLFDGGFTEGNGVRGRIGPIDSAVEIGLTEAAPNTAAAGPLGDARRQNRHKATYVSLAGGGRGCAPAMPISSCGPLVRLCCRSRVKHHHS